MVELKFREVGNMKVISQEAGGTGVQMRLLTALPS